MGARKRTRSDSKPSSHSRKNASKNDSSEKENCNFVESNSLQSVDKCAQKIRPNVHKSLAISSAQKSSGPFISESNYLLQDNWHSESPTEDLRIIDGHLKTMVLAEEIYRIKIDYFNQHPELTPSMRSTLLEWMMEVCKAYLMRRETLHYSINYVDRYLSMQPNIPKSLFQLVGVTALFLASKSEEIYPPSAGDFSELTKCTYSIAEILEMEKSILNTLDWRMHPPTSYAWLTWFINSIDYYLSNEDKGLVEPTGILGFIERENKRLITNKLAYEELFRKSIRILDFVVLDNRSMEFSTRNLAAASICIARPAIMAPCTKEIFEIAQCDFQECLLWMRQLYLHLPEDDCDYNFEDKLLKEVPIEEHYSIQTHIAGSALIVSTVPFLDDKTSDDFDLEADESVSHPEDNAMFSDDDIYNTFAEMKKEAPQKRYKNGTCSLIPSSPEDLGEFEPEAEDF